jgi:hypothetical protein
MKLRHFSKLTGIAILAATAVGCSSSNPATTTRKYAGAGSDWRWTLNSDGTFSATESESSSSISGTYVTTSTGFTKATITAKSGSHTPAVGTVIAGVEIPGFATLWSPILDTESQIMGTIAGGQCPTADFTDNYIYMQFNNSINLTDDSQREYFGTFKWTEASKSGATVNKYGFENSYESLTFNGPGITGTCDAGVLTTTSFNAYLAPGAAFVKITETQSPTKGDGLVAMPAAALGSLSAVDGTYAGFIYDAAATTKIRPITATASNGTLTAASVSATDLVTADGAVTGTATLTDVDLPSAGFIKGNVNGAKLICMGAANVLSSGKTALYCLGQNPSDHTKPYMLVLGSK